MPHAVCWAAAPKLIWTMVITNLITFLSYISIGLTLLYLVRRTGRVIAKDWGYFLVGFALFIASCGSTHLLEVITTWIPIFWVDAWTNVITAALSAYVAIMLIRRVKEIAFGINDYGTRLSNTENEKTQMQQSLLDAQKLEDWSRMSAAVSHEIKNPLQAIQNLQYLIQNSEGVSPQIAELAKLAEEEAGRVLTISDASLSFIRQAREPEQIDLCHAVESVKLLLAPLINSKQIDFRFESHGDCNIHAFAGETRQVLLNVIRNACEAVTTPHARVSVELIGSNIPLGNGNGSSTPRAPGVKVIVTDQGVGIDAEILPTIFQFGMTTKGNQGNGMGLWTVKHILTKHRGEVHVDSTRGQGTRVELWWPRDFNSAAPGPTMISTGAPNR
jgi:signal transduction histidine kinase